MKKDIMSKKPAAVVMLTAIILFTLSGIAATLYQVLLGDAFFAIRGLFLPALLLIPFVLSKLGFKPGYYLYTVAYTFMIFAYSYGVVMGGFKNGDVSDKISHFFSGFLFAMLGYCIYYRLCAHRLSGKKADIAQEWALSSLFALGFSALVAVVWEIFEFSDFLLTGNDSQNHLTTGVFDTMLDMSLAMGASLVSVAGFLLYRFGRVKLLTALVVEEFYAANCAKQDGEEQK